MKTRPSWIRDRGGSMAVAMVIVTVISIGLLAIILDLGHLFLVKGELRNAADAAALAGARALFSYSTSTSSTIQTPNWSVGQNEANATIQTNKADRQPLLSGTVATGYWSLNWTSNTAAG